MTDKVRKALEASFKLLGAIEQNPKRRYSVVEERALIMDALGELKLMELDSALLTDAKRALWAIAQTYSDDELRIRAQERLEKIDEQRCIGRENIFNSAAKDTK